MHATISLVLPLETAQQIEDYAKFNKVSKNKLVRLIIEEFLDSDNPQRIFKEEVTSCQTGNITQCKTCENMMHSQ